jgi:hypothetical protein
VQDLEPPALVRAPHRAHWQPTTYNALHGGLERWFEPIAEEVTVSSAWSRLLIGLGELFATLRPVPRWYIEAHQFRIDTASGIGRPTPEGAHRDGVDYIAILLVDRVRVLGGETRVFPADSGHGVRFTLAEPWSALLLDDARVVHETTPIQSATSAPGWRDTLVLTYRAAGFQAPHPGLRRFGSRASRAEILVVPVESRANELVVRQLAVPRIEQHMLLLIDRRTKQLEEATLRVERDVDVPAAV